MGKIENHLAGAGRKGPGRIGPSALMCQRRRSQIDGPAILRERTTSAIMVYEQIGRHGDRAGIVGFDRQGCNGIGRFAHRQ